MTRWFSRKLNSETQRLEMLRYVGHIVWFGWVSFEARANDVNLRMPASDEKRRLLRWAFRTCSARSEPVNLDFGRLFGAPLGICP